MAITPFHPPQRILMGPGPSDVSPRVLEALSRPTIGHLDPLFVSFMDEMKMLLKFAFQTDQRIDHAGFRTRLCRDGNLFRQSGRAG